MLIVVGMMVDLVGIMLLMVELRFWWIFGIMVRCLKMNGMDVVLVSCFLVLFLIGILCVYIFIGVLWFIVMILKLFFIV